MVLFEVTLFSKALSSLYIPIIQIILVYDLQILDFMVSCLTKIRKNIVIFRREILIIINGKLQV